MATARPIGRPTSARTSSTSASSSDAASSLALALDMAETILTPRAATDHRAVERERDALQAFIGDVRPQLPAP